MNKNRYKLIFSHARACLVPVAEYISHTKENNQNNKKNHVNDTCHPRLSLLYQYIQGIFLATFSSTLFANNIIISSDNNVKITENNIAIIDIKKPEYDGISDNRFEKFNVTNGAVFKNNTDATQSHLVGHLEKNNNLNGTPAKAILTQVTGKEKTSLKGGLEVAGHKADLLLINPNGISINGVQTFNTDRFIASTSKVIDPKQGLNLSVEQGTITIEKDGLATDGLKSVEIVAKKLNKKVQLDNRKGKLKQKFH